MGITPNYFSFHCDFDNKKMFLNLSFICIHVLSTYLYEAILLKIPILSSIIKALLIINKNENEEFLVGTSES